MTIQPTTLSIEEIWRRYDAIEQRLSASFSERMLDLGSLCPGMNVLDLATGRGEPAIPAAKRVFPGGSVFGVDTDSAMLQMARERADREGVTNLELMVSDVQTLEGIPHHSFDVAFARWGLMYLPKPVQALRAVRKALGNGGVMVAAVWINPDQASFFEMPRATLAKIAPVPPVDLDLPGTFYYSDLERLSQDMEAAGFTVQHSEVVQVEVMEVTSDIELIAWARAFGMSKLLQGLSAEKQDAWERELVIAAEAYRASDGTIRFGGSSRIVVAG